MRSYNCNMYLLLLSWYQKNVGLGLAVFAIRRPFLNVEMGYLAIECLRSPY